MEKLTRLFAIPILLVSVGLIISGIQSIFKYQTYSFGFIIFAIASMNIILAIAFLTTDKE